jgi:hypothetical protein
MEVSGQLRVLAALPHRRCGDKKRSLPLPKTVAPFFGSPAHSSLVSVLGHDKAK